MDNPKKDKVKHQFTPAEAADYLRQLADALEKGHITLNSEELELEGEVKVKQELKTKSGKATLKINLKIVAPVPPVASEPGDGYVEISQEAEPAPESGPKPSFKKLKKAMSKSFASLKAVRKAGNVPSADEVALFTAQGREMCSFDEAKYGAEFYPRFLAALEQLEAAAAAGAPEAVDAALTELAQSRAECHDKFK